MPLERQPYNPLNKQNLGVSVAEALLSQPVEPLAEVGAFEGAGIYALYYTGDFGPYQRIVAHNTHGAFRWPQYVGKAVPPGARSGRFGLDVEAGDVLYARLREHRASVQAAENLDEADFYCRALLVDDIWIPLGESLLIRRLRPLWNQAVPGFGIHHPGGGRYEQAPSDWDVLHPGRPWVKRLTGAPTPLAAILAAVGNAIEEGERSVEDLAP